MHRVKFQNGGQTNLFEKLAHSLGLVETKQIRAALPRPTVRVTVQNWRAGRHQAPAWAIGALADQLRQVLAQGSELLSELEKKKPPEMAA